MNPSNYRDSPVSNHSDVHTSVEPSGGLRSFDRVLIPAPAPPDSTAHTAGWMVTILSDQLTIRYAANKNLGSWSYHGSKCESQRLRWTKAQYAWGNAEC